MGRHEIEIDDELVAQVAPRHPHLDAAVDAALRLLVAEPPRSDASPLSRDEALAMRGSGWDVDAAAGGARPDR